MSEDDVEEVAPPLQSPAAAAPSLAGGDVQISAASGASELVNSQCEMILTHSFACTGPHRLAARALAAPACALPAPPLPCGREASRGAGRWQRGGLPQLLLLRVRRARVRVPPLAGRRPSALQRARRQRAVAPEARQRQAAAHAGSSAAGDAGAPPVQHARLLPRGVPRRPLLGREGGRAPLRRLRPYALASRYMCPISGPVGALGPSADLW